MRNLTLNNPLKVGQVPWGLALITVSVHTVIAFRHGGPVAVPDIPSYLYPALSATGLGEPLNTQFHPGLGLMLAPATLLGVTGANLHTAALLLNAAIAAMAIPLAYQLALGLGSSARVAIVACLVCAVFPVFAAGSRTAWPEPLLTIAVLAISVTLISGSTQGFFMAGLFATLSVASHPRALVFCSVLIASLALSSYRKNGRPLLLGLTAGAVVTTASLIATSTWLWPRVSASLSTATLDQRLLVTMGQFAAIMGVSCGFAGFALAAAWRCRGESTGRARAITFNVFGVVAMAVLGGLVLGGGDRPDLVMYGRYVSPFALPLTVIGLCFVAQNMTRRLLWIAPLFAWVVCTIGAGWFVEQSDRTYRRIMTLSNGWAWTFASGQARTALLLAIGMGALSAALVMSFPRAFYAATTILIGLCALTAVLNHQKLAEIGGISERQTQLHSAIPKQASCISFDGASTKGYLVWLYRLERPELSFSTIDLRANDKPCGDFVIAGEKALENCSGASVRKSDPDTGWAIWRYPTQGCN